MRLRGAWCGLLAGACVASACVAGACGTDPGDETAGVKLTPRERLARAARTTADAETARIAIDVTYSGVPRAFSKGPSPEVHGRGEMTLDGARGRIRLNSEALGGVLEELVIDGVIYLQIPDEMLDQVAPGVHWIRTDPTEMLSQNGLDPETYEQVQQQDPTQMLRYLAAIDDDVEIEGPAVVRGVDTTHYSATLDTTPESLDDSALRELGIDPDGFRDYLDTMHDEFDVDTMPIDIWLDAGGVVRREQISMPFGRMMVAQGFDGPEDLEDLEMAMTIEFYEFGFPVHVEAPPEDDVIDAADIDAGAHTV